MFWSYVKVVSLTLICLIAHVAIGASSSGEARAAGAAGATSQDAEPPAMPYEGTESIVGTLGKIDVTCILRTWRIKGVGYCMTPEPRVCLWVENAFPNGVLEVVRQPHRTHYAEMKGVIEGLRPVRLFGVSSSHTPVSGDGTTNHFTEARVYTFIPPIELGDIPIARPSGPVWQVDYVSELDGWGWRSPVVDALTSPRAVLSSLKSCDRIPDPLTCSGTWGSYYPRIGFVNHPSRVIAAHLQALRAGRAASMPIGRIVLAPYQFEPRTGHYVQMIQPIWRPCVSIGSPFTKLIETAASSRHGAYAFIHFGVFEECRKCTPVILTSERPPQ